MMVAGERARQSRLINVMIVTSGLGIGGAETVVRDLAHSVDRRRFNLSICCLNELGLIGEELSRDGVDIFVLHQRHGGRVDYLTSLKLLRAIRERRVDVMHTHTTYALVDAALCKLMLPRVKVVHTFHFGNYPRLGRRALWMQGLFSRMADRLVAVGMVQRQQIMDALRLRDSRIGMVWNGVQPASPAVDPSFRSSVGADGRVLVGTIASLIEQKGLRDLLAVARRCGDAGDRLRFVLVGEGHMRAELAGLRRQLGLEDTVAFTGWLQNAAARALPAFDVFFQPSHWEAMSIAVLEAMAAGKAIVATRVGDNGYMLEAGVNGLLVEPGDIDTMAAMLMRLAADAGLRQRLGDAAAARFGERFTVDHMTRAYEEIYRGAVGLRAD